MSPRGVTGFSSRSAPGRRMTGSGEPGVSIDERPWESLSQDLACQRDRLAHRPPRQRSGSPFRANYRVCVSSSFVRLSISCRCGAGFLTETELGRIAPHAMQNDGELAGNSDPSSRHTAPLGHVHAPCSEARPFLAEHEQRMSCLIEGCAGEFVAASADLALNVRLTRLIASGVKPRCAPTSLDRRKRSG